MGLSRRHLCLLTLLSILKGLSLSPCYASSLETCVHRGEPDLKDALVFESSSLQRFYASNSLTLAYKPQPGNDSSGR